MSKYKIVLTTTEEMSMDSLNMSHTEQDVYECIGTLKSAVEYFKCLVAEYDPTEAFIVHFRRHWWNKGIASYRAKDEPNFIFK